jgi:hypothetical protein
VVEQRCGELGSGEMGEQRGVSLGLMPRQHNGYGRAMYGTWWRLPVGAVPHGSTRIA